MATLTGLGHAAGSQSCGTRPIRIAGLQQVGQAAQAAGVLPPQDEQPGHDADERAHGHADEQPLAVGQRQRVRGDERRQPVAHELLHEERARRPDQSQQGQSPQSDGDHRRGRPFSGARRPSGGTW